MPDGEIWTLFYLVLFCVQIFKISNFFRVIKPVKMLSVLISAPVLEDISEYIILVCILGNRYSH